MTTTSKEISQLFEKSTSIQLPSHEEILIYVTSSVNPSNFGANSSDKVVSFSYAIFYRKEEHVSDDYVDLNKCIFDAFEEAWRVQHVPPPSGWSFND